MNDSAENVRVDSTLLKVAAVLLVCNSHLEPLYPVKWLAADGLLGMALFYMLAGWGLTMSDSRKRRGFVDWYGRRLVRLYPAVWIVTLAVGAWFGTALHWSARQWAEQFIYPTNYGFVAGVVILYVPFFFAMRMKRERDYLWLAAGMTIPYFAAYIWKLRGVPWNAPLSMGNVLAGSIFYFQTMLIGAWMARRRPRMNLAVAAALLVALMCAYVGMKLLMIRGHYAHFYFLLHWSIFAILYLGMVVGTADPVVRAYRAIPIARELLVLLAGLTLEMYLVHTEVIPYVTRIPFPANVVALIVVSMVLAWSVASIAGLLTKRRINQPARSPGQV
jgi:peptidoglycan/LPS O-acetylase OafA/YrhL